ncbi:leucyl-tRNA synthetase [Massarina eburnea CBS 473.64]|uniref:leucine--tRNA ligase n=1 Tax=Massarina eburnea CBS 473.64 TaxID=1395130 RepID=A0A6A6S0Y7_9PLEO|nr:leucyl-tRNA synthetase [Massarina eburnea CBS 473.64]
MRSLPLRRVGWRPAVLALPPRRFGSTTPTDKVLRALTAKWQPLWEKSKTQAGGQGRRDADGDGDGDGRKAYILPMFPYPSGTLHLGHLRVYTISDVLARARAMMGYDVLHPIGWDAFGLPAENAAIERGVHPADWTAQNIDAMKKQMMGMGGLWDWDREFRTCDPAFYKHTQRLFLRLHQHGLAYQAKSLVNWDPVDQTVLANEQVDASGCSWRSGATVEKKMLKQWFLNIKKFQKPLLEDLDSLAQAGNWPERVLAMQRNWIGRSVGTQLRFKIKDTDGQPFGSVDVFTTRLDTLLGVQYVALSLNHPIVQRLASQDPSLQGFLQRAQTFPSDTKKGYALPGVQAHNPLSVKDENFDQTVPVFVAPYVLDDYGSGAVMGVPAHDTRDFAFWQQNRASEPVKHVIVNSKTTDPSSSGSAKPSPSDKPTLEKGFIMSTDPIFNGLSSDDAILCIFQQIKQAGGHIEKVENWRLRDWLISRQRYWGTPIPIIHCSSCGAVPVPEDNLPVQLPNLPASYFQGRTGNPLAEDEHWKKTTCPKCQGPAERETDTMDTFMDSSWYFFRFLDPHAEEVSVRPSSANRGMPVDIYVGGVEHAILHLLYARFISKFLTSINTWPGGKSPKTLGEPFKQLITQGMVHGKTYSDPVTGRFLRPEEVDLSMLASPTIKGTSVVPKVSYEKMSKSKYNGVDPGTTIATYGADATRAHMLFQAPVSDVLEWDETKISGILRWLKRVLRLSTAFWYPEKELETFRPQTDIDESVALLLDGLIRGNLLNLKSNPPELVAYLKRYRKQTKEIVISDLPSYLRILNVEERTLLAKTYEVIDSVRKSYTETYSLNTVVSDLMTLTNAIWDTPHVSSKTPYFKWLAVVHLLRLMAPIAPGVAEEGWHTLISKTNTAVRNITTHPMRRIFEDSGPSVFAFGFPKSDPDIISLCQQTMTCVVQFDGRKKFDVEILKPLHLIDKDGDELNKYILNEIPKTEVGRKWMGRAGIKNGDVSPLWKAAGTTETHEAFPTIPKGWFMIVANRGRIVNLVSPKTAKGPRSNAMPPPVIPSEEIKDEKRGENKAMKVTKANWQIKVERKYARMRSRM